MNWKAPGRAFFLINHFSLSIFFSLLVLHQPSTPATSMTIQMYFLLGELFRRKIGAQAPGNEGSLIQLYLKKNPIEIRATFLIRFSYSPQLEIFEDLRYDPYLHETQ